jgi:peptidoglycan lytic transglycosylase
MKPHAILRVAGAVAAPGTIAVVAAAALAPAARPDHARAAVERARPPGGDVAIARRELDVVSGRRAVVTGRVTGMAAGGAVALERRSGDGWRTIDRDRTGAGGAFAFRFRPVASRSAAVRVRAGAVRAHAGRLNVYRRARASWYGPGLYGGRLGCGGTLTPGTLGVASKSLPCGAKVTLRHGERRVRVRVVDRGPYAAGRELDLTAATKERLGFAGVGSVLVAG